MNIYADTALNLVNIIFFKISNKLKAKHRLLLTVFKGDTPDMRKHGFQAVKALSSAPETMGFTT